MGLLLKLWPWLWWWNRVKSWVHILKLYAKQNGNSACLAISKYLLHMFFFTESFPFIKLKRTRLCVEYLLSFLEIQVLNWTPILGTYPVVKMSVALGTHGLLSFSYSKCWIFLCDAVSFIISLLNHH